MSTAAAREARFRSKAPWIMELLQHDFGLDLMSSAAVLGNLGHECAGFTLFQEGKPLVPGSKGGYGWAQWTGPRRTAFEAYCKRNRLATDSDKANYGWLFVELGSTERTAIPAVKKAKGLAAKVEAFERAFERASENHKGYDSRVIYANWALDAYAKATAQEKLAPFLILSQAVMPSTPVNDDIELATVATPGIVPGAPVAAPEVPQVSSPTVVAPKPSAGIFGKLLGYITGNVRGVEAKTVQATVVSRPGLAANGDPALYDAQKLLVSLGYPEVGDPDGLTGRKTRTATMLFRDDNGLPASNEIDDEMLAALLKAKPVPPNEKRAGLQAKDLRQAGNQPIKQMDKVRNVGLAGTVLSIFGAADKGGLFDAAQAALTQGQDGIAQAQSIMSQVQAGIASVISIVQWCIHNWWIIGLIGGFFLLKYVAKSVLEFLVLARQSGLLQLGPNR